MFVCVVISLSRSEENCNIEIYASIYRSSFKLRKIYYTRVCVCERERAFVYEVCMKCCDTAPCQFSYILSRN